MQKTLAVIHLLLIITFCFDSVYGAELWVDRNSLGGPCSDDRSREEVSQTTPWCTLGVAGSQAKTGDTVTVREGVYKEGQRDGNSSDLAVLFPQSGNTSYVAATGERVTIAPGSGVPYGVLIQPPLNQNGRPSNIEIRGFEITNAEAACLEVFQASEIVMAGLDVHGCNDSAVLLEETERVTLQSSNIHDNSLSGNTSSVDLFKCGRDNVIRGNKISGNADRVHEEEGHGVIMDTCLDQGSALIENNEISGNQGWCVVIYASDNASIRNNICKNNGTGGPTSYGETKGEITTVGSSIDIEGNTLQPSDGSLALSIRSQTSTWGSNWSTIDISDNNFMSPAQARIIGVGESDPVTVDEFKTTFAPWGEGGQQTDSQPDNQGDVDEDQIAEEEDQTAEEEDQTAEEEDQTAEEEDQTAEDEDRAEEERADGDFGDDNFVESSENSDSTATN